MDVLCCLDLTKAREKSMSEGVVYHLVIVIPFKEKESATSQYHVSFNIW